MVNGFGVVGLVNGHSGVNNVRLNSLLLDHWLNMFVNMMMDALALDDRCIGNVMFGIMGYGGIPVLGGISLKCVANLAVITMVDCLMLNGNNVVVVLLRSGVG